MAVRDRNLFAWQAYVITMSFVSVGLLVLTFLLWSKNSAVSKINEDRQTQLTDAGNKFALEEQRTRRLLAMMGNDYLPGTMITPQELENMEQQFKDDEKLAQVEKDYKEAMALFPPGTKPEDRTLIQLPETLVDGIRRVNEDLVTARGESAALQAKLAAVTKTETEARQAAVAAKLKAEQDLQAARQSHTTDRNRLNQEKEAAIKSFNDYRGTVEQEKKALRDNITSLTSANARQKVTIDSLAEKIREYENINFESPQGKIVKVLDGGRTIWINLGRADGLQPGVPFAIIDESSVRAAEAEPKAMCQVTRIVSEGLCVAELTVPSDYSNPVVTGDMVYSLAWRAGIKRKFALVGMMDVNGDRRDDVEQVKQLILRSGGEIDAHMDTNGTVNGPGISHNTTILVLGTDTVFNANAGSELTQQKAKQAMYAKFISKARQYSMMEISLDKLLGYLQNQEGDRTIPLGNRISADSFPIKEEQNPPVSNGPVSELFTPRKP